MGSGMLESFVMPIRGLSQPQLEARRTETAISVSVVVGNVMRVY